VILVASCTAHGLQEGAFGAPDRGTSGQGLNSQRVCGQLGSDLRWPLTNTALVDLPGRSKERKMELRFWHYTRGTDLKNFGIIRRDSF